jgi:hypothetical protein
MDPGPEPTLVGIHVNKIYRFHASYGKQCFLDRFMMTHFIIYICITKFLPDSYCRTYRQDLTAGTGEQEFDSRDRTARTGEQDNESRDRTIRRRQPEQEQTAATRPMGQNL